MTLSDATRMILLLALLGAAVLVAGGVIGRIQSRI